MESSCIRSFPLEAIVKFSHTNLSNGEDTKFRGLLRGIELKKKKKKERKKEKEGRNSSVKINSHGEEGDSEISFVDVTPWKLVLRSDNNSFHVLSFRGCEW